MSFSLQVDALAVIRELPSRSIAVVFPFHPCVLLCARALIPIKYFLFTLPSVPASFLFPFRFFVATPFYFPVWF